MLGPTHPPSRDGEAFDRKQLQHALNHLWDPDELDRSSLAVLLAQRAAAGRSTPGTAVRQWLLDAIEETRQAPAAPRLKHRSHALLFHRYVEGRKVSDVCAQLSISDSEYYRAHDRALAALSAVVTSRLQRAEVGPARLMAPHQPEMPATPFLGREREMECLLEQEASVLASGQGRIVLIQGDGGIGKTRLADEFGRRVEMSDGLYLFGRYPRELATVYGPWVDAIAPVLATYSRQELAQMSGPYGPYLATLFPGFEADCALGDAALNPLLGPGDQQRQLHEGLFRLLAAFSAQRPLVLFLDDLHWAPDLGILHHLIPRLDSTPVLILASVRPGELALRPDLQSSYLDVIRRGRTLTIDLPALDRPTTARLVANRLATPVAAKLSQAIYRRTGGNPFFIEETVSALLQAESGTKDGLESLTLPLPHALGAMVLDRIGRLGDVAERIFPQAALLGEEFRFKDLLSLTGVDDEALLKLMEAALAEGLIVDRSDTEERYAFRDEHVREVLYETIPTPRRRRWHRVVGESLEASSAADSRLSEMAYHFVAAGDLERGARYSFQLGQAAEGSAFWSDAVFHYRRALACWEQTAGHLADRADLCRRVGDLVYQFGIDLPEGLLYLQKSLTYLEELGDMAGQAELHTKLGREYATGPNLQIRDLDRAMSHFRSALDIYENFPIAKARLGEIYTELAAASSYALDIAAALDVGQKGLDISRGEQDPDILVRAQALVGGLLIVNGQITKGSDILDEALELASGAGLTWGADYLLALHGWRDCFFHPARVTQLAWALPLGDSNPLRIDLPLYIMGACAYTGEFTLGQAMRSRLDQTLQERGMPAFSPDPEQYCRFLLRLGESQTALQLIESTLTWASRTGDHSREVLVKQVLGEHLLFEGDFAQAEITLRETIALARNGSCILALVSALPIHARCLVRLNRLVEAATALDEARAIVDRHAEDWGRLKTDIELSQGMVFSAQGLAGQADAAFQAALERSREESLRWDEAEVLYRWGQANVSSAEDEHRTVGLSLIKQAKELWACMGVRRYPM